MTSCWLNRRSTPNFMSSRRSTTPTPHNFMLSRRRATPNPHDFMLNSKTRASCSPHLRAALRSRWLEHNFSHKNQREAVIHSNMGRAGHHHSKWNKPSSERQVVHDFTPILSPNGLSHRSWEENGGCQEPGAAGRREEEKLAEYTISYSNMRKNLSAL